MTKIELFGAKAQFFKLVKVEKMRLFEVILKRHFWVVCHSVR